MFRGKRPDESPKARTMRDSSVQARLSALGYLLDSRSFTGEGLCILEVDGGFVVNGFKVPERGAAYSLVQQTETVGADELARTIEQLRTTSP